MESRDSERWHLEQRTMSKEVEEDADGTVESDDERGVKPPAEPLEGWFGIWTVEELMVDNSLLSRAADAIAKDDVFGVSLRICGRVCNYTLGICVGQAEVCLPWKWSVSKAGLCQLEGWIGILTTARSRQCNKLSTTNCGEEKSEKRKR